MLAKLIDEIPDGDGWQYEPKWDGFRAIVFRDGDETLIQSRDLKPLDRYFPGAAAGAQGEPARALRAGRRGRDRRVRMAWTSTRCSSGSTRPNPASGCSRLRRPPVSSPGTSSPSTTATCGPHRRENAGRSWSGCSRAAAPPIHLTPCTGDPATAADWFNRFEGAGLDGVVAKRLSDPYLPGQAWLGQDQARSNGGLRRGRFPLAQERAGHARWLAAPGFVRRRWAAEPRRHHGKLLHGEAPRAGRGTGAATRERPRGPSLGRMGANGRRSSRRRASGCPA